MPTTVRTCRLIGAAATLQSLAVVTAAGSARGLLDATDALAGPAPAADPARVTAALSAVSWAGLLLCAGWFAAAVLACARDLARHPSTPLPRSAQGCLRPAFVRSLLVVLVGGCLATPRPEPVADHDPGWALLEGLPLPGLPAGTVPAEPRGAPTVRVRRGDCLWSITASLLGPRATDREVAAAWPALHRANLAAVGADPDLLRVGTVLHVPATLTTARPGAAQ